MANSTYANTAAVDAALDKAGTASQPGHVHTKANITDFPTTMAPTAHTHGTTGIDDSAVTTDKINAAAVTNAKLANMETKTVKGRLTAATGEPEEVAMLDLAEYALDAATTATEIADAEFIALPVSATSIKKITWANFKTALGLLFAPKITTDTRSETTYTITTWADKTIYKFSNAVTSLTVSNNGTGACRIEFTAGTGVSVTLPTQPWDGDVAPTFTAGKKYTLILSDWISAWASK